MINPDEFKVNLEEYKKKNDLFQTPTGILLGRSSAIYAPEAIMLGGRNCISGGTIIRGDLKLDKPKTFSIHLGKNICIESKVVIRPPFRLYKNEFVYHPMKLGDCIHIGEDSIINAVSIGNNVIIGKNCIIGRFAIIKSNVKILDGTIVPPHTVIPSHTIYGGSPAQQVGELTDFSGEIFQANIIKRFDILVPDNKSSKYK